MLEILTLFTISFLSATLLPGGSEAYLAYLIHINEYPLFLLVIIATIGNSLGGFSNYLIGFWINSHWFHRKKNNLKENQQKRYHYANQLIKRWGNWALLFSWTPIIGDILCLIAGLYKLNWIQSLMMIAIGKFCRYIVFATISESVLTL